MEQEPKQKTAPGVLGGLALCLLLLLCLAGDRTAAVETSAAAAVDLPGRTAAAARSGAAAVGERVIPIGRAVGIKLFSDGVLVVGLSDVETENGACSPGRDCGLKEGDVITHINGSEVDTIEAVQDVVKEVEGDALTIQAVRGTRQLQLTAEAVPNEQGIYQLGVWLRDSMAGIGTMTFYDPQTGVFAALGHGINDTDTATLMPLESGGIMGASVSDVKKGVSGQPGELHGQFDLTRDMGSLFANTDKGVFGRLSGLELADGLEAVPVAKREQVHTGDAVIRSNVRGDEVEEFDVKITHVSLEGDGTRSMMLQVTDPDLLERTGGIVQGMVVRYNRDNTGKP